MLLRKTTIGGLLACAIGLGSPAAQERNRQGTMVDPLYRSAHTPSASAPGPAGAPTASAQAQPAASSPPAVTPSTVQTPRKGQIPGNDMNLEPPTTRLYKLMQDAMARLHEAKTDKDFKEILARFQRTVTADTSLPDTNLLAEKRRLEAQGAELHRGEPRVYAGSRTEDIAEGLLQALDQALQDRHRGGSPSPH